MCVVVVRFLVVSHVVFLVAGHPGELGAYGSGTPASPPFRLRLCLLEPAGSEFAMMSGISNAVTCNASNELVSREPIELKKKQANEEGP